MICCKKRMKKELHYSNGEQITSHVCLACGCMITETIMELDSEILEEYRKQYNYKGKHNETIYVFGDEK